MNETLSPYRLWYLLRGDLITGFRSLIVVSATLAGITLVAAMILPSGVVFDRALHGEPGLYRGAFTFDRSLHRDSGLYHGVFTIALFAWGLIATSRVFRAMHDKTRNEAWLLLPASSLEKTLARLIAVTVGFVAWLLVFVTLVSLVVESLNLLLFGKRNGFFNPFDPSVWENITAYIFLQSIYFLGAAWFRRAHFVKTTLAITLTVAGLAVIALLTARIAFADLPQDLSQHIGNLRFVLETEFESLRAIADAALSAALILFPLACWSIAWLRVSEVQASDGV